jgi:hypothetical protein
VEFATTLEVWFDADSFESAEVVAKDLGVTLHAADGVRQVRVEAPEECD